MLKSLEQVIDAMTNKKRGEKSCDISLKVQGETWQAYTVNIAENDLLFYCNEGTATILIDWYGPNYRAELYDWETTI